MSSDQVIELSVEETNDLRRKLGLAPLRGVVSGDNKKPGAPGGGVDQPQSSDEPAEPQDVVLELSVEATNDLRKELGLPPLRTTAASSSSKVVVHHAPAINVGEAHDAEERIERARLKRQVEQGLHEQFEPSSLADEEVDATIKTWAQKMRRKGTTATTPSTASMQQPSSVSTTPDDAAAVGSGLHVAHRRSDFEQGTTTTLTLADAPILEIDAHRQIVGLASNGDADSTGALLENVNLADAARLHDGLKIKRQLELGAGRAGAYAGFDDDEFEELGGTQAPSRQTRGGGGAGSAKGSQPTDHVPKRPKSYFQIGALQEEEEEPESASDLFAAEQGKAVSLEPARADVIASDFLTAEEDREANKARKTSKSKKESKFKTKKEKKKPKKHKRKTVESDDDEAEETTIRFPIRGSKSLLDDLEETAVGALESGAARKRRRRDSEDADESREQSPAVGSSNDAMELEESALAGKRAKFDAIMAKANERTMKAFQKTTPQKTGPMVDADDEPDDAFLNAALSKARRIGRLKELAKPKANAAETVAAAVLATADHQAAAERVLSQDGAAGTVDFVVDEASEFTRALQSRTEQRQRQALKKKESDAQPSNVISTTRIKMEEEAEDDNDKEVDMEEMAKEIQPDREDTAVGSAAALEGATGATVRLGRGLGGVLGLLQQTGELTRKNAGKEELRGRAKDERHYEDYQPLDLAQVVKIDERTATDKDKDLAHRQIKLEYRDKHGRLLTRKEAFRELSYQFHGYGSGKRKEEKKMVQIAREQAEARASQSVGTLGALQATQKATGKAFVVHKT